MDIERRCRSRLALAGMIVLSITGLTACAQHPVEVESNVGPPPDETPATSAPDDTGDSGSSAGEVEAAADTAAQPACTPAPAPKPKPKPKPVVRKPAPKQPETAPMVENLPQGAAITADVKPFTESVASILGRKVQGAKGEDLGRVVDVLADPSGRVRAAIVDFGGFLGVGNRRIAVDWSLLRFDPDDPNKTAMLSLTRDQLQAAPEYRDAPHPQALMIPTAPTPVAAPAPASTPAEGK